MRLAIITTHPIQYYAPVFRLLAQKLDLKVFYTLGENSMNKHDPGFDKFIEWDIDLLNGYKYQWVNNVAANPGSHHFSGINNPDLIAQLTNWQPNAILVYGWAYKSHLSIMRHFKKKIPIFFRGDSTLLDHISWPKKIARKIILKWVYSYIDHAFYVGTNNKAYFKNFGLKESQLTFAPHAIDNKRFAANRTNEIKLLKQKLGINDNDLLLLFAGKFEAKKDPLLLLKAFLQIQQPNTHLLFVGNGEMEKQLKADAFGNANIHFMDFINQSDMPVIYQAADLFCLTSKGPGESWGLAVNEAMACSKAILVSDKVGCAIDLVTHHYNGMVIKSGNIHELTIALRELTTSKKKLAVYGKNSATIIKNWNFETATCAIENKINT